MNLILSFVICIAVVLLLIHSNLKPDKPREGRWHKKATPTFGGVAIYLSVAPFLFLLPESKFVYVACVGCWILFTIGLLDDIFSFKAQYKFAAQIVVALFALYHGYTFKWFSVQALNYAVTFVWIVGIINAVNFIDNMDGLCTGIALLIALLFLICFPGTQVASVSIILCSSLFAFLIFNFSRAKIFMGDCGSLPLGFLLSLLCLYPAVLTDTPFVPVLLLGVPVIDITFVTVTRIARGQKPYIGGRDHVSHRLVGIGLSEREVVLFLYLVTVLFWLIAQVLRG